MDLLSNNMITTSRKIILNKYWMNFFSRKTSNFLYQKIKLLFPNVFKTLITIVRLFELYANFECRRELWIYFTIEFNDRRRKTFNNLLCALHLLCIIFNENSLDSIIDKRKHKRNFKIMCLWTKYTISELFSWRQIIFRCKTIVCHFKHFLL
jgi:hypothetical protein